MSEWIKCSERLPDKNDDVLVCRDGYQSVAYWSNQQWIAANVDCMANMRITPDFIPTHWMQLPEPPK